MENQLANRIESRIDKTATGGLAISSGGNLDFANLNDIMEVAKVVAISQAAIPKHLRDNVGACLAICIQASEWKLSPFAVANKSYVVNDRIAFEAQLVAAVILKRAPISGRIKYEFTGEGERRRCKTSATLTEDGSMVEYESPEIGKIPVKNSPLWKNDPDQQLGYFSVRAMCRRHFPDVLLGVYTPEEMESAIDVSSTVVQVGTPGRVGALKAPAAPAAPTTATEAAAEEAKAPATPAAPKPKATPKPKPEPAPPQPAAQEPAAEPEPNPEPKAEEKPQEPAPTPPRDAETLRKDVLSKTKAQNIGKNRLMMELRELKWVDAEATWEAVPLEILERIETEHKMLVDRIMNPD